jgi:Sec-independent protein translocase protein TatA
MIVMGPKSLPDMARKLGRWTETFRRAAEEFKRQIMSIDQEPPPPEPESHYPDYDYGNGEDHNMTPDETDHKDVASEPVTSPEVVSETAGTLPKEAEPKEADASPSEVLPDSAQYYGNEELVAGMEGEKKA